MKHLPPTIAGRGVLLLSTALILLALAHVTRAQTPAPTPAALIKNIVVNNRERTEAGKDQAVVTRAGGEIVVAAAGLTLYRGDVVETFADTKVTLLFLDAPVAERDNEVIVDAGARVGISSTDSWWGRIWAKVKGAFDSRTDYVRLAAVGTEYEFNVFKGEERATLVVLEGKVEFAKGTFPLAGRVTGLAPQPPGPQARASSTLFDAFVQNISWQEQFGRVLEVPAGQVTSLDFTYNISNDCRQTHHFEFHTSENSEWLQLAAQKNAAVAPGTTPINATLNVDATRLPPGQYKARVYATCVDCNREPACTERQLEWPLIVTVKPGPTPTPTPTPTGTPIPQTAGELEEVTLTKGIDRPKPAATPRVLSVLEWTNNVILTAQPTYSAQNIIPHFATVEERSRNFRDARRRAVLGKEPGSNKTLGDVYNDWGQGAQAVRAYEDERSAARQTSSFEVDRAEAYRQTGQLNVAQDKLASVLSSAPGFAPARNAEGNLNLDRARIALDRGNSTEAVQLLKQARESYELALRGTQATTGIQGRLAASSPTIRTNLGETNVAAGDLAVRDANMQEAGRQYQAAVDNLEAIQQADSQYSFPVTDLGRAYQGLGDVAKLEGRESEASALYESARRQHERAIGAHPDFAEAYFNLGDLYDDLGNKQAAEENYERAIKARPEQPAAYYPLAVLLQKENPRRAAELAATYLQLEPEVFRQGEKARNAERIVEGFDDVVPPVRPGAAPVPVPGVLNKTQTEAVSAIEAAGFTVGRVKTRSVPNSRGRVVEQKPAAGTSARRGSAVDLVVSEAEAELVKVPGVIGDDENGARSEITKIGLTVGRVEQQGTCKSTSIGKVIEQHPAESAKAEPGTAVDLVVGSPGEPLPDFRKLSRDEAEAEIQRLGLPLRKVTEDKTEKFPEGAVIKQSPKPGTPFAKGCADGVELTTAKAFVYVDVRDYVGKTLEEARRMLREDQLNESVSNKESPDKSPGIVMEQSPLAGSRVHEGTRVRLVVSIPVSITVRSVVGKTLSEAMGLLKGLDVKVDYEDYTPGCNQQPDNNNRVLRQDITPGQKVRPGAPIHLVVGRAKTPVCISEGGKFRPRSGGGL